MAQPSLSEQVRRLEAELGVALFARVGRGLELTEAGRLFRPHAERTLASAEEAAESVREIRDLTGGTVEFGTFGSAHHYLLAGLLQDFRSRYPNVRVRAIGQNSAEVADAVRDGHLEAGLVALPIDDRGLDVQPAMREEILYISADPERVREPMTIERLAEAPLILFDARFGADDPMRTQLRERAQHAGVKLEPQIEVEYVDRGARARRPRARRHRHLEADDAFPRPVAEARGRVLRPAAVRHVRLHHAPQRPPLPGHPRVHAAGREAGGGTRGSTSRPRASHPRAPPR